MKTNKHQKYAVKTMKKAEIIKSKHVDHIENEKNILEKIQHPFVVSAPAALRTLPPQSKRVALSGRKSSILLARSAQDI